MADLSNIPTEQLEAFLKKGSGASSSPDLSNISTADLETLLKNNAPTPQTASEQGQGQPTFAQSLTSDWSKRADKVRNSGLRTSGAQSIYAAGQVAGGAFDVAGETLSRITPAFIKGGVKNVTDFYGGLASQGINKLQETFPEATSAIKNFANSPIGKGMGQALETGINIGSLIPVGKGAQLAAPKVGEIAAKVITPATQEVLEKGLKYTIRENYSKAFKPTVAGKKTFERTGKYFDNVQSAVEDITVNKEKLLLTTKEGESVAKLPGNPSEFAQSISQRKTDIYKEYHQMAVAAGDEGSKFNSAPLLEKLDTLSNDLKQNPQTRGYAESLKSEIEELHGQSPEVIEARIKDLNNSLGGYYEGRTGKAKAQVDASVAELMRSELDNSIMKSQGEGYQNLKRRYGSLLAIEGDVNKRAIVYGRQNSRGFFDLTDVFTGSAFTHGLLTMNPALMASAGAGIGIKNLTKWMNSPDRYIKSMFSKTENILKRRGVQPGTKAATVAEPLSVPSTGGLPSMPPSGVASLRPSKPTPSNISPIMPGKRAVPEKIVQPGATSGGKITLEETVLGKSSYGTSIYKEGKLIGEGTFTIGDDGVAKVGMIRSIAGRDIIAPTEWRNVLGQLKEKYPQIIKFEGDRITRLPVKSPSPLPEVGATSEGKPNLAKPAESAKLPPVEEKPGTANIPAKETPVAEAGRYHARGLQEAIEIRKEMGSLTTYDLQSKKEWLRGQNPPASGNLTLYRATPTGEQIKPGDYVTNSLQYAKDHIINNLGGKGKITNIKATLDDIYPADSPGEFWYAPKSIETTPKAVGIDTFTEELNPMQKGKVVSTLNKQTRYDGEVRTVKEQVEKLINDGEKLSTFEEDAVKPLSRMKDFRADQRTQDAHAKKVIEGGKKTVYMVGEWDMGKTAYDYAKYLESKVGNKVQEGKQAYGARNKNPQAIFKSIK